MHAQYWVIGGDYHDHAFTRVIEGTLEVQGPFADRAAAQDVWRLLSERERYRATRRFTIAEALSRGTVA